MTVHVGLTGNIGAGKSTVARLLAKRGAAVIDADELASEVLAQPDTVRAIREAFGPDVVDDGRVDRAALARRVFADAAARRRLEAIVHPRVAELQAARAEVLSERRPAPPMIVHDVPLLFEAGLAEAMDAVVVVDAPLQTRIERVVAARGLDAEEVRRRDAAQWPAERKRAQADVVIENDGDPRRLEARVAEAWPLLLAAAHQSR